MEQRTKSYLRLLKPGITVSNTLSAIAGFSLAASMLPFDGLVFIGAIGGVALVIASACVANNILDRDIDKRMKRTLQRDVAAGRISVPRALAFAAILGAAGFSLLLFLTNVLTFFLGVVAYVWYVAIYGIAKRTTPLSTLIGGVAGSLPPVAGYTALTGSIDMAAISLFMILFFWQLPHFYAISMFRRDDYDTVDVPVWSVRYGMKNTKAHIFTSVLLYAASMLLLTIFGYTGVSYAVITTALSLYWIYKGAALYKKVDDVKWAKTMFGISLMILLTSCLMIGVGGYLP